MPTSGSCSIDTSIAIPFLNGETGLLERFEETRVWITPVVAGELLYGAAKSSRASENVAKVRGFLRDCPLLGWTLTVSEQYGVIKAALKRSGNPIPENDLWVAAFSIAHGLALVARDVHFEAIEGLDLRRW